MCAVRLVLDPREGDLERLVVDLARRSARLGPDPHVLCVQRAGRLADKLEPGWVSVRERQGRLSLLAPVALARLLRRLGPDVIDLHSGIWCRGAYASLLAGGAPTLSIDHGRPHPEGLVSRWPIMLGGLMTDQVVAVSVPLAKYLARACAFPDQRIR